MSTPTNKLQRRTFSANDFQQPGQFNREWGQLVDKVNALAGHDGPVQLSNHLNMNGNAIQNVVPTGEDNDVVTKASGNQIYGPSVMQTALEGRGSHPLKTVRRVNDKNQRESFSSFLNDTMSTPPNANTAQVFYVNGGATTQVTVPATQVGFADGSVQHVASRTDVLSNPASVVIVSITVAGNVATVTTATAHGLIAGDVAFLTGVTPSDFDGAFAVTGVGSPTTFTFNIVTSAGSGAGGTVSLGGVYYYYAVKNSKVVNLIGPFSADTPQNRLNANTDGKQIVAVAVLTSSGGVNEQSGGGGTPTTGAVNSGSFF
jgi:hypothetical protein